MGKRKYTNAKKSNTKKEEKVESKKYENINKWIQKYKGIIQFMITIIPVVCSCVIVISNLIYKVQCESFYHLPGKYFSSDLSDKKFNIFIIGFIFICCMLPWWYKKYIEKRKNKTVNIWAISFLLILAGMVLCLGVIWNLIEIMKYTNNLNKFFGIINYWIINHFGIIAIYIFSFALILVFGINFYDKVKSIKKVSKKNFVVGMLCSAFTVIFFIVFTGMVIILTASVEKKTKYEFVKYDEVEYVVLSEYNGKMLVVPFEICENGQYILKTKQYTFKEVENGVYEYKNLEMPPQIEKNVNVIK